ncbi:RNA polymerase sigma-70 factor, ECF subfamily [Flagellimonas taeanensis]|uniref:RNA polymerase sigma-70 factor, ECF subfamily n=1 Tax=Flagellimonas taeanensis TaxID=1005926 RepID=A0A1M6RNS7_9FLAO|nr:RNA polymerase sigma factor [Allomuricauda taeanensis]MEE1962999.1 RNA polymerase sigma factor [Allomuricauda taeanensis]SFB76158.1 RNA polymerase sigma-70 factor, ECF subfamily [Allomuricauda taeanensis]SHK34105.1 RNA polymerase sigma-70 factor, ECF subfamily [Allomuricauda taeanensis]
MGDRNSKDIALINSSLKGDMQAFRELVDAHKDASLTLACSILKDSMIAEDAVQATFIKVYQKLHTFGNKSKFSTWLYRIVVNTSYNVLKQQRKFVDLNAIRETQEITDFGSGESKEQDQKEYIYRALNALKPDEALVLRLFYLYGHKITEIQEITGFGKSKVKVALHRGRNNMEQELKKLLGNEIYELL